MIPFESSPREANNPLVFRLSERRVFFDRVAKERERWSEKATFYRASLINYFRMLIPSGCRVLEIGCGRGDLLAAMKPSFGVGVDISPEAVSQAKEKYSGLHFLAGYAEHLPVQGSFEYIILSDVLGHLEDIQKTLEALQPLMTPSTRIVITYYNFLWEPILNLTERLGLKQPVGKQNWLSTPDVENILTLANVEVVRKINRMLLPARIPFLSVLFNRFLAQFPFLAKLCLSHFIVARPRRASSSPRTDYSCSIIIPTRNERGNIKDLVDRLPDFGLKTELIFVDGNSADGTVEAIEEVIRENKGRKDIKLIHQGSGVGKGDAVRKGFAVAKCDIFMILDSDISVAPEDVEKFYRVLADGKAEFANGSRLVYPLEDEAMRTLNIFGNKAFSLMFTWLLGQTFRDTLCGTKAIFREDYERLAAGREYFGDFDPFGDYDLIFGAVRLNLKIVQVPVRYFARTYGTTKISRFQHGWLLLRMCRVAAQKLKFS